MTAAITHDDIHPAGAAAKVLRLLSPDSIRNILAKEVTAMTTTATTNGIEHVEQAQVQVRAAVDTGNARTVVIVQQGDNAPVQVTMPSARSLSSVFSFELFADRSLPANSWQALSPDEHVLEIEGRERFVGLLALERAAAVSSGRGSDRRYFDGTTLDLLLAGIARALPRAQVISADVATMVPILLWQSVAHEVQRSLRSKVIKYAYNGRSITLRCPEVQVLREAEAAGAAIELRDNERTLILDGGGRTFNAAAFAGKVYKTGVTLDQLGVEVSLDAVDKRLQHMGRALDRLERLELLEALREGLPYTLNVKGARVQVAELARAELNATAEAFAQELHAKVKVELADRIVFIGGAAYPRFMGDRVRELLSTSACAVELAAEPELKNVQGALATLGARSKKYRKV